MKISDARTFVVANPPPHHGGLYWVFVKLTSDSGISGYGEAYSVPFHPRVVAQMIEDVCDRHVIGSDPFKIERLWRIVYSSGYTQRPDTSIMGVLSAIEIACWDIVGKELGKPVYELLGGQIHESLRSYTYLYPKEGDQSDVYRDADLAAERALEYVDLGFTAVKFDPVGPYTAFDPRQLSLEALDRAETFVSRIREAVGSRCDLLFGTHGQMTTSSAIRLARRLEPYDPLWFEEPVPPEDLDGYREIKAAISIPVAGGECEYTRFGIRNVLQHRAIDILQPDTCAAGGLSECKKIADMANAFGVRYVPHVWGSAIGLAAALQLLAVLPRNPPGNRPLEPMLEFDRSEHPFRQAIVTAPIEHENGVVQIPDGPGLGIEIDRAALKRFTVTGGMT